MSTSRTVRPLSRGEAKELTRRRLLAEALAIVETEGEAALTPSAVSRAAGVAQSTFYVHFRDREELLHELADWLTVGRHRAVREARRAAGDRPGNVDRIRAAFGVALDSMVAQPSLLRITARTSQENSVLGQSLRKTQDEDRTSLIAELIRYGYRDDTEENRRMVAVVADAFIGMSGSLAVGILEGRYDIETALDVIMRLVSGLTPMIDRRTLSIVEDQ